MTIVLYVVPVVVLAVAFLTIALVVLVVMVCSPSPRQACPRRVLALGRESQGAEQDSLRRNKNCSYHKNVPYHNLCEAFTLLSG